MSRQIIRQIDIRKTTTPLILLKFCAKVPIGPVIITLERFCGASYSLDTKGDFRCLGRYSGRYSRKKTRLLQFCSNFAQRQQFALLSSPLKILAVHSIVWTLHVIIDVWADSQAEIRRNDDPFDFAQISQKGSNWLPYHPPTKILRCIPQISR